MIDTAENRAALLPLDEDARRWPDYYITGYPSITFLPDRQVMMSQRDFDDLPEYSTSIPTKVGIGKVWKANRAMRGGEGWMFCLVVPHPAGQPDMVGLEWHEILERRLEA